MMQLPIANGRAKDCLTKLNGNVVAMGVSQAGWQTMYIFRVSNKFTVRTFQVFLRCHVPFSKVLKTYVLSRGLSSMKKNSDCVEILYF